MSEARPNLFISYLVSGEYDPKAKAVVEKTIRPIANRYFTRMNHREPKLVATDDRGMLVTVDRNWKQMGPVNDVHIEGLELAPLPPGIVKLSYFQFENEWQNRLIQHIRSSPIPTVFKPISVVFKSGDVRPPTPDEKDDKEAQDVYAHFQRGKDYYGQLVPRIRTLLVLIDSQVLRSTPSALYAHKGKEKPVKLVPAGKPVSLAVPGHATATFQAFAAAGYLEEGTYVVGIPESAIEGHHRDGDPNKEVRRAIQVAFSVQNIFGEFDFQVLEFPSLECAILTHFAEKYSHLLLPDTKPEADAAPSGRFQEIERGLARFWSTAAVVQEKQKMVAGYVNADTSEMAKSLTITALKTVGVGQWEVVSEAAEIGGKIAKALDSVEVFESWNKLFKKMKIAKHQAESLKLVEQLVDGDAVKRFFVANAWKKRVVDEMLKVEEKQRSVLGRYMLMYKDKVNPETVKKLMKESMAPQLTRFEKLCGGNIARKAFWTLDTAMTIHQILGTAEELHSLGEKSKLEDAILQKHVDEYGRMFDGAPCLQAIPRLDVLRKAVDASVLGEDEKLKELIEQAASLTLKVLCLVPAVGQIAMLISLAVETIEALGSVADMASDVVDRYLWRHRSAGHRLAELAQMHALQVRAIEKHATSPKRDDAYTQLRVRVVALIGLLRLIERCGSRQSDGEGGAAGGKGSFADKVRHYQIGQYIDRYIMLSKGPFSVALSSGTPLDEVWLYACGNKDITWNDIQASMHSPTELVMDFARGSKTVVVPIAFHRHYPIHGMDSANPEQLARTFSLNFAGVVDKKMVYSRVYLRQPGETRWVPADEARFTVDPATDVRIAAVFKSQQDLRGIPMSLQLKRVDPLINVNGPIYKTPLQRVEKSLEDVDDKGLLSYTEEKAFIGDKDAYSCVFYPFYFYRGALIHGIKPVSHVGLSAHTVLKYRFELKAGDDGVWVKTGKDGGRDLAIHLDPSNRFHVDMVLSKSFLDHKSAQPGYSRMFATEYETTRAEGLYYRFSPQGKWQIAGARTKKGFSLNLKDPSSGYRWKQPFEILLVFSSELVNRKAWDKDPVKFPAQVGTREPKWVGDLGNTTGPSYPVEVVCVSKDVDFTVFIPAQVGKYLERMEFLKAGEVLPGLPVQLGHNARALFATRLAFNFSVEEKDRKMLPIFGVRPFGREYLDARSADRDAEYRYLLDLASPDPIGLGLHDFLELRLPPLPADFMAGTALAGDTSWVTDEHKQTLTEVQQVSAG